jgi:uncharacterized protein (TIGR02266 family)
MLTKRIVATDSAELLSALESSFFKREGFALLAAPAAETAYRLVEAEAPALAILDLAVLGEDGLACCRRIKHDPLLGKTALVLLLPQREDEALLAGCQAAGCDAVFPRPLEMNRLFDAVCNLLGVSQRLEPRLPVDFQAAFAVVGRRKQHAGRAVNLHAGGMFIAAETLFPVDTMLRLEFTLPGFAGTCRCHGRVAWVNHPEWRKKPSLPSGMGMQFQHLEPACLDDLRTFVARHGSGTASLVE